MRAGGGKNSVNARSGRRFPWPVPATLLCFGLFLASCQSGADSLGVESTPTDSAKPQPGAVSVAVEKAGGGELLVGMVTTAGLAGMSDQAHRDRIDGAKLAFEELANKSVALEVVNSDGTPVALQNAARDLAARKARVMIASMGPDQANALQSGLSGEILPVLALYSNAQPIPAGFYSFASDRIDGIVEGSSFALAKGKKRLVAVLGPDVTASEAEKLEADMKQFGPSFAGTLRIDSRGSVAGRDAALLDQADAIALVAGTESLASLMSGSALSKALARPTAIAIIPPASNLANALPGSAADVIFCRYDQNLQSTIGQRFLRRFGRPISVEAGYGYDAAALSIGLSLAPGGSDGLQALLASQSGFSGSLGLFRFNDKRRVQRGCAIFKVQGRNIVPLHKAPPSF